jgi:hypothetical protein
LYALAAPAGLEVVDENGRTLASERRVALLATQAAGDCLPGRVSCTSGGCTRVTTAPRTRQRHDVVVSLP